jgi:hypothetical protein
MLTRIDRLDRPVILFQDVIPSRRGLPVSFGSVARATEDPNAKPFHALMHRRRSRQRRESCAQRTFWFEWDPGTNPHLVAGILPVTAEKHCSTHPQRF